MIFFYHFSFQNMKIQWAVGKMGQSGSVGKRWGKIRVSPKTQLQVYTLKHTIS